jgi:hypothetical protein
MIDLVIIGAGPYGLSLAAYLRAAGLEFRIFGRTMESWKVGMPPGMLLKSYPWSSSLYDPASTFTLRQFCAERDIPYDDSLMPLPLETFVEYGDAFQARLVPHLEQKMVARLEPNHPGFRAIFDDGEVVTTNQIVIAVGVHPFKYVPPILDHLPPEALSHSGDYGTLHAFRGKEVIVLGSGASAIDSAVLLHEAGASVSLVGRSAELRFAVPPRQHRALLRRLAYPLWRLAYPDSGIGAGWLLKACADAPWLIHALPERWRLHIVRTTLGPLGGSSMKTRLLGKLPVLSGRKLTSAETFGDKVRVHFTTSDGAQETLQADHIVAATGYKIDLNRLTFLDPRILARIRTVQNAPVLSTNYESSVRGLYFIGGASANSFGPVARFAFGAIHPSRRLTRHFSVTPAPLLTVSKL